MTTTASRVIGFMVVLGPFIGCAKSDVSPLRTEAEQSRDVATPNILPTDRTVDRHDLNEKALVAVEEKRYEDADRLLSSAIKAAESSETLDRTYADSLSFLGRLHFGLGYYLKAEPHLQRAVEIDSKLDHESGSNSENLARSVGNLAVVLIELDRLEEAESLFRQKLEIEEQLFGPIHSQVATSLNNLGTVCRRLNRYADAEESYSRALRIREQILKSDDPQIATTLGNLGTLYSSMGKLSEAERLFVRAMEIEEKALGANHSRVATTISNLAHLRLNQGNSEDAMLLFNRCLQIREKALPADHPDVASTLFDLGVSNAERDQLDDAIPLLTRALKINEKALGQDHPKLLTVLGTLALIEFARQKFTESEAFQRRAMEIAQNNYGSDDAMVAAQRRWIAWCLRAQDRAGLADEMEVVAFKVLQGYPIESNEAILAKAAAATTRSKALIDAKKYFEAYSSYYEAGNCYEIGHGLNNESTAQCRERSAEALRNLGCHIGAAVFDRDAMVIRDKLK